jgi:hypothetical protein
MSSPVEKIVEAIQEEIVVFNIGTFEEKIYPGIHIAAKSLGVIPSRFGNVLNRGDAYFSLPNGDRYDVQKVPKTRDWVSNVLTRAEAHEKAVVAYDEDNVVVHEFDSATKAMAETGINGSSITACVQHDLKSAGKKDGSELSWEYKDPGLCALYDRLYPRKPKKPFYYVKNGENVYFKTKGDASEKTRGKVSVYTQQRAISASIKSGGTKSCRAGLKWFELS